MMTSLYIYYRVAEDDADAHAARVRAMLDEVAKTTGVRGKLLRRADDRETWMEIYEDLADAPAFEAALSAAVEHHEVRSKSPRMVERFEAV